MLFKKAQKMQNMSFSRCKKNQNVIFLDANIFQNLTGGKNFNSKSDRFPKFSEKFDFYLVFKVLTEWWYLLSTLLPIYFEEQN